MAGPLEGAPQPFAAWTPVVWHFTPSCVTCR